MPLDPKTPLKVMNSLKSLALLLSKHTVMSHDNNKAKYSHYLFIETLERGVMGECSAQLKCWADLSRFAPKTLAKRNLSILTPSSRERLKEGVRSGQEISRFTPKPPLSISD